MIGDQTSMLLLAGAHAAHRWRLRMDTLKVIRVPDGVNSYNFPINILSAQAQQERVTLEHFKHTNGKGCWLGYSEYYNALLYRPEQPLTPQAIAQARGEAE